MKKIAMIILVGIVLLILAGEVIQHWLLTPAHETPADKTSEVIASYAGRVAELEKINSDLQQKLKVTNEVNAELKLALRDGLPGPRRTTPTPTPPPTPSPSPILVPPPPTPSPAVAAKPSPAAKPARQKTLAELHEQKLVLNDRIRVLKDRIRITELSLISMRINVNESSDPGVRAWRRLQIKRFEDGLEEMNTEMEGLLAERDRVVQAQTT